MRFPHCEQPDTVDHVFVYCGEGLQVTSQKDTCITIHTIRFLPVRKETTVPYVMLMFLGLFEIWKSRMAVRHADSDKRTCLF